MKPKGSLKFLMVLIFPLALILGGCNESSPPKATSGVKKAAVQVRTGADGYTIEQRNVMQRLKEDNTPGAIKHLYVISPMSGQVLIYSTVKGKVTSSGKRLTPYHVSSGGDYPDSIPVNIGGSKYHTPEVLQDDGTYGSSAPYIYWWDTRGFRHEHYFTGGQVIHVSSQPIAVKNIIINMELAGENG